MDDTKATTPTPAFTFRLYSKSACNFMRPSDKGQQKQCFPAFVKRNSDLIKARKKNTNKGVENVMSSIEDMVEKKIKSLMAIRDQLDAQLKLSQTQVNYNDIKITAPTPFPANFSAETSKRGLQALLIYDHISVLLHQLNTTGCITAKERFRTQKEARHHLNSLFEQTHVWAKEVLAPSS